MDFLPQFLLMTLLILASAVHGSVAEAVVNGAVYCDQCKDGGISLFDYPLPGVKVAVSCLDGNGEVTMWREEVTNWFGYYSMKFDGSPDLSSCYAQVASTGQGTTDCRVASGPAHYLRLTFRMFDMEIYTVESLISQPASPKSFCPGSHNPGPVTPTPPTPVPVTPTRPPTPMPVTPTRPPAPVPVTPTRPPTPVNPPAFTLPPLPPLPFLPPLPPFPFFPPSHFAEPSACPHEKWSMPEYKCYWKVLSPDTKVAVVFGVIAARRYGTDMTLWRGLQGRGEPHMTLLREGTTALLNSYSSLQFPFHSLGVVQRLNWALMGKSKDVLLAALKFKRANIGAGNITCKLTPCK